MLVRIYSLPEIITMYRNNKHLIEAALKKQPIEGFVKIRDANGDAVTTSVGFGIFIVILLLLSLFIWIWALMVLIRYWDILPDWAKIVGLLSILGVLGGPIVTLIVVYVVKGHATP